MLINTGNISRKVLSKVLRSFVKNFERLQDIKFVISLPGEKPESARITSPNIRFGILKIGVGSPKWEVMLAYGLKKPLKNDKKNQYSVQNGIYATTFYFDENDQVYKMTCGVGIYTF